jgi:uncharacterized protein (UPF0261 family)
MRTNPAESERIGRFIADKLNRAEAPVTVLLPLKGVSEIDKEGLPFFDYEADTMLFDTLKKNLDSHIRVVEVDAHINDALFSDKAAEEFLKNMTTAGLN